MPQPTPGERFVESIRPYVLPAVIVLGVLVLVFGSRSALQGSPRFRVDPTMVRIERLPSWLPSDAAAGVAASVASGLGAPASLLGSADLQRWEEAAAALSPWIARVEAVSSRFPYRAEMQLVLRRPVLQVDASLWSADGIELGPTEGVLEPAPLRYAGPMDGSAIRECAAAAAELLPHHERLAAEGLALADVTVSEEGLVVFRAASGAQLVWGRSTRYHRMAQHDLPPAGRIEHLHAALRQYPGLEGVSRADLYLDRLRITPGP